ncbi:carbonic anhydrase/acetyltransferase-like protein (isoleucine patch superfamily) [Cryobacterium sp. CAN_C3]|nr:carbonic anhydrase/acetyltransferase-like protein (isoleucine patch superfamily) [Cryobacterium sp. CAN_C3]
MRSIKKLMRSISMMPNQFIMRRAGVRLGSNVLSYGRVRVDRAAGSTISLADNVILNADIRRNTLEARGPVILKTLRPGARLSVGKDSGITSATISAAWDVSIGNRVLIGAGVLITDSDHHVVKPPPGASRRHLGFPEPLEKHRVIIGNDVFIGARAIVLKGVSIGDRSVVGAGSVVTSDVPADVIAAGNPSRVLGSLSPLGHPKLQGSNAEGITRAH